MKLIYYSLLCIAVNVANVVQAGRGKLLWSNEFDSFNEIADNWNSEIGGHGWGNNEDQYYTALNAKTLNGNLIIEARREPYGGKQYTSSRLLSKRNYTYGVFEVRAKLPKGRGTWPAFWLLGAKRPLSWPLDGEIDVMEHVGYEPNVIHASIHSEKYNHVIGTQKTNKVSISDVFSQYHTYTLEWGPAKIEVLVDGRSYFSFYKEANGNEASWPFDNPHNMILNLAIGGDWGGYMGVDNTIFPVQYTIDYVRIYEHIADPLPTVISVSKVSFRAKANNRFVCADNYGREPLIANKDSVAEWETFEMTKFSDGFVTLKSFSNQKFVSADNYGDSPLISNRETAQDWEKFKLIQNSDNTVTLLAKANSRYVIAPNAGSSPLVAKSDQIEDWEKFYLTTY